MEAYKNRYIAGGISAFLSCMLLLSCSSEDFRNGGNCGRFGEYSGSICFGVLPDGMAATRVVASDGGGEEYTAGQFVLRSQNSSDTLCVRAIVSDGISPSGSGSMAATRAMPVSEGNFYDMFHVAAYWNKDGQLVEEQFYMDEDVSDSGNNLWNCADTYYWPGDGHTLRFYAWAPVDAAFSAVPQAPTSTLLDYAVPSDVADQKDIVVAATTDIDGNSNAVVPLTFRHICTAVRFETGSQMRAGTIKSVALKGVRTAGVYDMASDTWALKETVGDFTQQLNHATTGMESAGSEVTAVAQTFMMLPQESLPDGAAVEVVFNDGTEDIILSASIAGMEWPQGDMVTYRISISPDYEFKLSGERMLDAHYEIYLTNLVVSNVPAGKSWTVTAGDNVTIQAQADMNSYAKQGYWTDYTVNRDGTNTGSARGTNSYQGTGSGEFPIAIFVPENAGDGERIIALDVTVDGSAVQTIDITQYAPSWYGSGLGCERIEGVDCPWGFYWSSDFKLIYDLEGCEMSAREEIDEYISFIKGLNFFESWPLIGDIIHWIWGNDIPDLGFVDVEDDSWLFGTAIKITINLGSIDTGGLATSTSNGQDNTQDIYNFEGIQLVNEVINMIENMPGYKLTVSGEGVIPTENAAVACMKLNSWKIIDTGRGYFLTLVDESNVADWYLPSSDEILGMEDGLNPISGEYWTSTALDDNQHAWKYSSSGGLSQELRKTELHVRAVRKRP